MQKRTFLILLINSFCYAIFAQDTVYSEAYPKGIVCSSYNLKKGIRPVNNEEFRIDIPKKEMIKVIGTKGLIYENTEYKQSDKTVVPTDMLTGNIFYSEVIEIKGAKKKDLFQALKAIPKSNVSYELISVDETDQSLISYRGSFYFKFAGDLQTVYFSLTIKIKDEKIKYEYSNFRFFFAEQKNNSIRGGKTYTIDPTQVKDKPLEILYVDRYRGNKFWTVISDNIDNSIKSIKSLSLNVSKNEW